MTWRNVRLVLTREVRDQFRDRRTMFMMLVLPLLLYPGIGVGIMQMTLIFSEQPRTVVVLGNQHLPAAQSPITASGAFDARLFEGYSDSVRNLVLIAETPPAESAAAAPVDLKRTALLENAREIVRLTAAIQALERRIEQAEALLPPDETDAIGGFDDDPPTPDETQLKQLRDELAAKFVAFDADLIIAFPEEFDRLIDEFLAEPRPHDAAAPHLSARPIVIYNSANERSQLAYNRVSKALTFWERELLATREANLSFPSTFIAPLFERRQSDGTSRNVTDVAQAEQHSANVWSRFFPTLLILMTLTGAFYPSIDLGAGEKERGTMETLLISPAARSEIVLGKFLTILLFSILTALVNIASMGGSLFLFTLAGEAAMSRMGMVALPSIGTLAMLGLTMVPLAGLFSALSLALATFARSTKEGQYYLTPMMLVVMGLTIVCMSPAVELTPFNSVIPVMGIGLLLKNLIQSGQSDVLLYVVPVLLSSLGYSLLALWWANEQFHKEEVLFREAERFELGLWFQHLFREKERLPSTGQALFCFVAIMLLQFLLAGAITNLLGAPGKDQGESTLYILLAHQLALIAAPTLFMGLLLISDFGRAFRIRMPSLRWWLMGAALPFLLIPLAVELQHSLQWFFPPAPESVRRTMEALTSGNSSVWALFTVVALAPAICEELAFRGFILTGFARHGRTRVAIVFSALLFGMMHMIPQQVFNAFLMGLVLGLLAIRSGSLFPCIVFHLVNNAIPVLASQLQPATVESGWMKGWIAIKDNQMRFTWLTLALCGISAAVALGWMLRTPNEVDPPTEIP